MSVIKIADFGGEQPSTSARSLSISSAQICSNLFAGTSEFRPLRAARKISANVALTGSAPKTLYRMDHTSESHLRDASDEGSCWRADDVVVNYVKGQINGDLKEHTYYTWADGTVPPRVLTVSDGSTGKSPAASGKQLGVPPHTAKLEAILNSTADMTTAEATDWMEGSLTSAVYAATRAALQASEATSASRYSGRTTVAGPVVPAGFALDTLGFAPLGWAAYPLNSYQAIAFDNSRLELVAVGGSKYLTVYAIPRWGILDKTLLKNSLGQIMSPMKDDEGAEQPLWVSSDVDKIVDIIADRYSVAKNDLDSKRAALTVSMKSMDQYVNVVYEDPDSNAPNITKMSNLRTTISNATKEIDELYNTLNTNLSAWITASFSAMGVSKTDANTQGLVATIGERVVDTRFYIVTFVNDDGEESKPGPMSDMMEPDQNDTVTIKRPTYPTGRDIKHWVIYRSNTGMSTSAFQFVVKLPIATVDYLDETKGEALGESCPTLTWDEPPTNLRGLVGMPNGIMAGFFASTVCFCDPYHMYAWPTDYQITTEHPIVGLGVFGHTIFVGTRGTPYFITGSDSASMSAEKLDSNQSCISAGSIVSVQGGVIYASPDGLCQANGSGITVLTKGMWTREDWQRLNPASIVAAEHEGIYYFCCTGGTAGDKGYALGDGKLVEVSGLVGKALFTDRLTDTLYAADSTGIYDVFGALTARMAQWHSGKLAFTKQEPMAWVKVYSNFEGGDVLVQWIGDGVPVERSPGVPFTATFNSLEPQRLPAGRFLEHEVSIQAASRITSVVLVSTTAELQAL